MIEYKQNPLYMQLAERLCDDILKGKFYPNERIVSMREFAEKLQINVNTAMRAYDLLQHQDIIYKERGMGYYLSPNAVDLILQFRKQRFIENQLPELFRQMRLLKIDFKTIEEKYKKLQPVSYEPSY
jgi:DNA-binding transcriptional regulator YhcF (GntR family)